MEQWSWRGSLRGGERSTAPFEERWFPAGAGSKVGQSVGEGGHGDVDDEGGAVLDAAVGAVGQGPHAHAVRPGLPQRLRGEHHPLPVLIPQGERHRRVLLRHLEGGPGVHDLVVSVGHQADQILPRSNAEGQRQQLVLQGVRAQVTLQVIGRAAFETEPSKKQKTLAQGEGTAS